MRISDAIERFIKEMLAEEEREIELQRNELAEYFRCAPSQINYVLSTRFTPDHGYVTESRRGGGGYIRITRITSKGGDYLSYLLEERIGDSIDARSCTALCTQLAEREILSLDDAKLIYAALTDDAYAVPVPEGAKNAIRAKVLKNMLIAVAKR